MLHFASVILALIGNTATIGAAAEMGEPDPKVMSQSEIRAFNAKLDKEHPYFIRCKKSKAIGSNIARLYSCRTNAQWIDAAQRGNDNARETMDAMSSKASSNG